MTKINKKIFLIINLIFFISLLSFCPIKVSAEGQNILDYPGASELPVDGDGNKTIFTDVKLYQNNQSGKPVEIKPGDYIVVEKDKPIRAKYEFFVHQGLAKDMKRGDYFDFELPQTSIKPVSESQTGKIYDERDTGKEIGEFITQPSGEVRMILTQPQNISNKGDIKGTLEFFLEVDETKVLKVGTYKVKLPYVENHDVTINIGMPGVDPDTAVLKEFIRSTKDPTTGEIEVTWKVLVNPYEKEVLNPILKDRLSYDKDGKDAIRAQYRIDSIQHGYYGVDKKIYETGDTGFHTNIYNPVLDNDYATYTFQQASIDNTYVFTIVTTISPGEKIFINETGTAYLYNHAEFHGAKAMATANSNIGLVKPDDWIKKEWDKPAKGYVTPEENIKWKVGFNEEGRTIPQSEAVLIDTYDNNHELELVQETMDIKTTSGRTMNYEIKPIDNGNKETGFEIHFKEDITEELILTYETKIIKYDPKYRVENFIKFNKISSKAVADVKEDDGTGGTGGTGGSGGEGGTESTEEPPEGDKPDSPVAKSVSIKKYPELINWEIFINAKNKIGNTENVPGGQEIDAWSISDEVSASTLYTRGNILEETLEVWDLGENYNGEDNPKNMSGSKKLERGKDYDLEVDGARNSFELTWLNPEKTSTRSAFYITYDYGIDEYKVSEEFKNKATYNYSLNRVKGDPHTAKAKIKPEEHNSVVTIDKRGLYKEKTDTIEWTIGINTKKVAIGASSQLLDTITDDQEYVPNSARLELKKNPYDPTTEEQDGSFEYDEKTATFTGTFPEGSKKYYVFTFETKIKEIEGKPSIMPNEEIINTAYYKDANTDTEATDYVHFDYGKPPVEMYVNKSGKAVEQSEETTKNLEAVDWLVEVNPHRKHLQDVVIRDNEWENQRIDPEDRGLIKLEELDKADNVTKTLQEGTDYDLLLAEQGMWITFKHDVKAKINLTYRSRVIVPKDLNINESFDVKNGVYVSAKNSKTILGPKVAKVPTQKNTGQGIVSSDTTYLKIIKKDSDSKKALEGAEFALYRGTEASLEKLVNVGTSNQDGVIEFSGLTADTYFLIETRAPDGYDLPDPNYGQTITIEKDGNGKPQPPYTQGLVIENSKDPMPPKPKVGFNIIKYGVDENGDTPTPLQGAVFSLYEGESDRGAKVAEKTSDSKGKIEFRGLVPGKYFLKETKAPAGYELDEEYASGKVVDVTHLSDGEVLSNEIEVFNKVKPTDPEDKEVSLKIIKYSGESSKPSEAKVLEGAEFTLYEGIDSKGKSVGIQTSNTVGEVVFDQLAPGKYFLKETKAPEGHVLDPIFGVGKVIDLSDGESKEEAIKVYNAKIPDKPIEIAGKKIWVNDDFETLLPDKIVIELYQNDKLHASQEVTEASNWEYRFKDLPAKDETGKNYIYTIKEQAVPGYTTTITESNYDVTNTLQRITINGEKWWHDEGYEVNRPTEIKVQLLQDNIPMDDMITTVSEESDWKYSFEGLPKINPQTGHDFHYTVVELEVPDGYTVSYDGTIIINSIEQGSVTLIKQDKVTKETLKGAIFKLESKNHDTNTWDPVSIDGKSEFTTNDKGEISVEKLNFGDYRFIETKAPDGYIIDNTPIEFKVEGATRIELTFYNEPEKPLPETGGTGILGMLFLGTLLLFITSVAYYRYQKVGGD